MAFAEMNKLALMAVTLGIILVVGFLIISNVKTQSQAVEGLSYSDPNCANSTVCNATQQVETAIATIPGWIGLVILVAIGGILIALVKRFG